MKTPRVSPKTDKTLLVINIVVFIAALIVAICDLYYKEYISAIVMLVVVIVTVYNSYLSWRRLKNKA